MNVCVKNIKGFPVDFQLNLQVALRQKYRQARKVLPPNRYRWETPDKHVTKVRISSFIEEAVNVFKKSIVTLKTHIYSKKAQNRTYNEIKGSLDHGEILVHVDYAES